MKHKRGDGEVYKRGKTFWICYYHRGVRHRESAHTTSETAARKLLRERLADTGRGKTAAITASHVTFEQMAAAYIADYEVNGKRSLGDARKNIEHLRGFFGCDLAVDIKTPRIVAFSVAMQKEGYSNGSINRYLSTLHRAFTLMIRANVLESAPFVPMLEEHNVRLGTIEPANFERLLGCLPSYLKNPVEFLYRSAWRVGEMSKLEWRDVNLAVREIRLRPENSKNKKARVVPLRGKLLEVIERARAQRRLDCLFVFHDDDGKPIGDFRKGWRAACQAAGLGKLLVHDLRRSGVTNMRRAGVPETTAMSISGHKTVSTFRRYQIEETRDIEVGLDMLDAYIERETDKPKVAALTATEPPQIPPKAVKAAS